MTRLVIYFNIRSNLDTVEDSVRTIFQRADRSNPPISRSIVEDLDWTGEWKKSYTSFPIGDDFFVMPSWEDCKCPDDRLPIRIDPGQAFGTGTHVNLNDNTVEGFAHRSVPAFSVQYHPEASPGPHDSYYLFKKFFEMMKGWKT